MDEDQDLSVDDILEESRGANAQPLPTHVPSLDDYDDPAGPPEDAIEHLPSDHHADDNDEDETAHYQGGDPTAGDG